MTDEHTYSPPDEVEQHEPGIYRVDTEALFGHIDDIARRQSEIDKYTRELKDKLPDGSIILPMEVEKIGHADDADQLVTQDDLDELREHIFTADGQDALDDIIDLLKTEPDR